MFVGGLDVNYKVETIMTTELKYFGFVNLFRGFTSWYRSLEHTK